jgi:glycosyltransferase involved in cell wall biosynthesis
MLSFIVPAYNEELELPSTLAAIRAAAIASSEPYEIIVVNDGSTDATAALAAAGGARVLTIHRRQIAAARNAGAREARGDILFFVDADTRIAPKHVSAAMAALKSGCAGGGARVEINEEIPRWARIFVYLFAKLYFGANLGAGAFLFTTRGLFDRAGGFDEQLFAGEEIYFSQALKKLGRFRLLGDPVVTSGRKLRMHSGRHVLNRSVGIILRGKRGVRSRAGLDLWYDGKRETEALKPAAGTARP